MTVRLVALAFGSVQVRAWVPRYRRVVWTVCGPVSKAVPLVIYYRGSRRRALKFQKRLELHGYRVRVRREARERERESSTP